MTFVRIDGRKRPLMMKVNSLLVISICFLVISCSRNTPEEKNTLVIATAANLQFVMTEILESFENQYDIKCQSVVSSSGKLTAQIMEGAPYDVFVSADMKYPQELFQLGLTLGKPEIYAYGQLVLWSMKENIDPSIKSLTDHQIQRIAIPNPKIAPYGHAAEKFLIHNGILEMVEAKLVFGESISQTNQFITTSAVDMGFTAKSVVLSQSLSEKGNWVELDPDQYPEISQGIVIINNGENQIRSAKKLYDFILSEEGKKILNKFGYKVR